MRKDYILLEDRTDSAPICPGLLFENPVAVVVCNEPNALIAALNTVDELRQKGLYLVGFLSYEAGYLFQSLECPQCINEGSLPLLYFLAFKMCNRLTASEVESKLLNLSTGSDFSVKDLRLNIERDTYHEAFAQIQRHLLAGDTYQVNFTSS